MDILEEIRRNLAKVSTPWTLWRRYSLIQRPPPWMTSDDGLAPIYSHQNQLLKSGSVTWAAIVQANMNLFKPGPQDHPAQVVYALNGVADPDLVVRAATRLYQLKNTTPANIEDRVMAALISDEMDRNNGVALPASFDDSITSGGANAHVKLLTSSFMVFRSHLPSRTLSGKVFPLLVHPEVKAVMIVPQVFWPRGLQHFD